MDLISRADLMNDLDTSVVFSGRTHETGEHNPEVVGAQKVINRIEAAPEVKAIPIEWITNWISKEPLGMDSLIAPEYTIKALLYWWRKKMNKFCDNCLHHSVCEKEGKDDPAMVFCDDCLFSGGLIPIEWLKQWEEKHKNDPCYCGFVSEEIIKDWEKENEIDNLLPNCVKHARVMKEIENQLEDRNGK